MDQFIKAGYSCLYENNVALSYISTKRAAKKLLLQTDSLECLIRTAHQAKISSSISESRKI